MPRLTVNVTLEFEQDLKRIMEQTAIETKSKAVRLAVRGTAARLQTEKFDYSKLLGLGNRGTPNPNPRFENNDLWEKP